MSSNSALGFMDIIIIAGSLYMLYGYVMLMFKNEIKRGLIISSQTDPKKCKDLEGYKKYTGPRLLVFGICGILGGAAGLARDYIPSFPAPLYWAAYVLFAAVIVWFAISVKKAEDKFF